MDAARFHILAGQSEIFVDLPIKANAALIGVRRSRSADKSALNDCGCGAASQRTQGRNWEESRVLNQVGFAASSRYSVRAARLTVSAILS